MGGLLLLYPHYVDLCHLELNNPDNGVHQHPNVDISVFVGSYLYKTDWRFGTSFIFLYTGNDYPN